MVLLKDIAIGHIKWSQDGKSIEFNFSSLSDGSPVVAIECANVIFFRQQVAIDYEGFAAYVGEVSALQLAEHACKEKLVSMGYGFRDAAGHVLSGTNEALYFLQIEGGELSIDVCCRSYRKLPA